MKEKGKGRGKGKGRKKEGKQGKASGGKNSRSLARLSWPRMQPGLALLGQSGLATAKPHSSLPLAVADPNFLQSLLFSRLYSITSPPSQILSPPHASSGSHMSDLSDVSSPNALYRIHPTTLISIPCLFLLHFFPQICPIQLHASPSFGTPFPFLLHNVDPSPNLPPNRGLCSPPQRRQS